MSVDTIVSLLAIALSLAAAYIPAFNVWFETLSKQQKALFMLGGAVVIVGGAFGLTCAGVVVYNLVCNSVTAWSLVKLFFDFAIANQVTFLVAVRPFQK